VKYESRKNNLALVFVFFSLSEGRYVRLLHFLNPFAVDVIFVISADK